MKKYYKYFPVILIGSVALVTLIPFIFTGFSNGDDLSYFLASKYGHYFKIANLHAQNQGRFYFIFTIPLAYLCYLPDNYLVTKGVNIFFVLLNFIIVGFIAKEIFRNKWPGFLCFILMVIFISIKGLYNPIVSYPIYFTGSFLFILLSLYYSILYRNSGLKRCRNLSAAFFAFGLLFYETYLVYLPLIVLIVFTRKSVNRMRFSQRLKETSPFLITGTLYCIIYFTYRLIYPSQYVGATISHNFSFNLFFNSILNFASGSYPLSLTFTGGPATYGSADYFLSNTLGNIILSIVSDHVGWILKSAVISLMVYFILNKISLYHPEKMISIFFISLAFIYLPSIPLSLTEKYLNIGGIPNYVTSYFSFIACMFCLSIIILFVANLLRDSKYRKIVYLFISISMGLFSILNDYANHYAIKSLRVSLNVFDMIDHFLKTEEYKSIPENAFIYAPELYDNREDIIHFTNHYSWSRYFSIKSKKKVKVSGLKYELIQAMNSKANNIYYIKYGRNQYNRDQYIAFSAVSGQSEIDTTTTNIVSDNVNLFYYTNNKTFSVSFDKLSSNPGTPLIINNDTLNINKNMVELDVTNKNYRKNFVKINIRSHGIDVNSIFVSNIAEINGNPVYLE